MTDTLTKENIKFVDEYFEKEIEIPVIYNDDYLQSNTLDLNLARLCCTFCCCSYDEKYMEQALLTTGFTDIELLYFKPQENTASVSIGKKNNNIFIIIRGSSGEEWYNNFRTGLEDTHQGYYDTVGFLKPLIKKYIHTQYNIIITGHSRGGALANLLASELIKDGRKNVFAYTFACPNVTAKEDVYSKNFSSIYNFVYEDDFITHCPLREWGYNRYGNTVKFKTREVNYKKLKQSFKELSGKDFVTYKECNENIANFIDTTLHLANNPYEYYNKGYFVDEEYLTLYQYFKVVCDIFNHKESFNAGITLLATKLSEFAPLTEFLASGIDVPKLISQGSPKDSCAMFAHSPLTYLSLLNTQKMKVAS